MESSPDILELSETNPNSLNSFTELSLPCYLLSVGKSIMSACMALRYMQRNISKWQSNSLFESPGSSYIWLFFSLLTFVSYVFCFRSHYSHDSCLFGRTSDIIDKTLSLHLLATIFVFGDFNGHHVRRLTHSNVTDRAGI